MKHTSGNFAFGKSVAHLTSGDTITGGNYTQVTPDTDVFAGIEDVTVTGGNFVNCHRPASWTCTGGNWCQIEFCSHERPELIAKGLTPCADDCAHRSAEKVERVVEETEYRKKLAEAKDILMPISLDDLTIEKVVDKDGVTVQAFKVREHEYRPRVVQTGGKVRKGLWAGVEKVLEVER